MVIGEALWGSVMEVETVDIAIRLLSEALLLRQELTESYGTNLVDCTEESEHMEGMTRGSSLQVAWI